MGVKNKCEGISEEITPAANGHTRYTNNYKGLDRDNLWMKC